MQVIFATSNKQKVKEARESMREFGITIKPVAIDFIEGRSEKPEVIVKEKIKQAYEKFRCPIMVEDSGFFIQALGGFPMTHIKFSLQTLGLEKVMQMMEKEKNRKSEWRSAVAYYDGKRLKICTIRYVGLVADTIKAVKRKMSCEYWRIFIPTDDNPQLLTLSEMKREYAKVHDRVYYENSHFRKLGKCLKQLHEKKR